MKYKIMSESGLEFMYFMYTNVILVLQIKKQTKEESVNAPASKEVQEGKAVVYFSFIMLQD